VPKSPLQNGPATKWATQKRAITKQAAPKWSRHKDVYPLFYESTAKL